MSTQTFSADIKLKEEVLQYHIHHNYILCPSQNLRVLTYGTARHNQVTYPHKLQSIQYYTLELFTVNPKSHK